MGIEKEYGIEITQDKLHKLETLTVQYFDLSEANTLVLQQIIKDI